MQSTIIPLPPVYDALGVDEVDALQHLPEESPAPLLFSPKLTVVDKVPQGVLAVLHLAWASSLRARSSFLSRSPYLAVLQPRAGVNIEFINSFCPRVYDLPSLAELPPARVSQLLQGCCCVSVPRSRRILECERILGVCFSFPPIIHPHL